MKYDAVIFDLDGTVLDTLADIHDALNFALTEVGLPTRELVQTRKSVGNGLRKLVERSVPAGTTPEKEEELFRVFTARYKDHAADKTSVYPGITDMLTELRAAGLKTAVISNKLDTVLKPLSRQYFGDLLDIAVGERANVRRKPAPDAVFEVIKALGCSKDRCIYVGDSEVDLETAANSGLDCIAVCWGNRDKDFLAECGATVIVSDPKEIVPLVTK